MPHLEWFLSFAEITFPVFLLTPTLITSFRRVFVHPVDLARFYAALLAHYLTIVLAIVYSLGAKSAELTFVFLLVSVALVSRGILYVMKWTIEEQVKFLIERMLHEP